MLLTRLTVKKKNCMKANFIFIKLDFRDLKPFAVSVYFGLYGSWSGCVFSGFKRSAFFPPSSAVSKTESIRIFWAIPPEN